MAWTEETIVAEFRTHIAYWQEKLRLRDIAFRVRILDYISDDDGAWCAVCRDNGGANMYGCDFKIRRGMFENETRLDVWKTCAHELVHVMNWSMSQALDELKDWFSTSQMNLAKSLLRSGNEHLAYKWEEILATIYASDAPPNEIP